jgi:uncharacterized protein (TIGR02265 family)
VAKALDFRGPKLTHDIDVDRHLRACPSESTTQGVFFRYIRDSIEADFGASPRLLAGLETADWMAFRKYPMRDFIRLSVNAARIAHTGEALSEGLRRLGWLAFQSFSTTMAGRVVLFAFGERLENMISALPKAYAVSVPGAVIETEELGPRRYRITMKNLYNFVDAYHLGVLEGAILAMGFQPTITVRAGDRLCDAIFEGGW